MADKKISEFEKLEFLQSNDLIPFVRGKKNYVISFGDFYKIIDDLINNINSTINSYFNNLNNNKVNKSGDTMTGFLTLHSMPFSNNHAATKQYVDQKFNILSNNYIFSHTYNNNGTISEDYNLILVDASNNNVELNLPSNPTTGKLFYIKKIDSSTNIVTINGNGKTIDGGNFFNLNSQYSCKTIAFNGSNWYILNSY